MTQAIQDFLTKLGIASHPGLQFNYNKEGYSNFTFGCRAGPGRPTVNDLAHELAHAAQFGPRNFKYRAVYGDFSFRMRKVTILGNQYDEPKTAQATLRELDTFAYQAHLMQIAGVDIDLKQHFEKAADLMVRFMPDWLAIPGHDCDSRKAWCVNKASEFYTRRKAKTALKRLIGWLDETQKYKENLGEQSSEKTTFSYGS